MTSGRDALPFTSLLRDAARPLALIVALGVGLRLLAMVAIWSNGGSPLIGDEGNYVYSALPVSEGREIPDLWLWIRAPGYIFFSALVFALTGGSLLALNLAQIVLAALLQIVVFLSGVLAASSSGTLVARRTGLWAAAFIAVNPLLILSDNFFLSEALFNLLVALLVFTLALFARTPSGGRVGWALVAAAGVVSGLGLLTRPNLQTYIPLVALWIVLDGRKALLRSVAQAALFCAISAAVVLPWSLHNLTRFGHFFFVDTVGAYVLYLDNTDLTPREVNADLLRFENQGERQQYAFEQGFKWIAGHKAEFARRTLLRMATSWSADPFADLRYPVRDKLPGTSPFLRDTYALSASVAYLALTALAIGGLLAAPRSPMRALVLLFLLSYLVTLGLSNNEFRYRFPVLALTAPFAGYAIARRGAFWPLRLGGKWRPLPAVALAFSLAFTVASLPLIVPDLARAAQARALTLGCETLWGGGGLRAFEERASVCMKMAQLDRVYSAPWRRAGQQLSAAGKTPEALESLKKAVAREPGDWRSAILLSSLFRRAGQAEKAASVANNIIPTFNPIMQDRAWSTLKRSDPPPPVIDVGGADIGWVRGFHVGEEGSDAGAPFTYRWSTGRADVRIGVPEGSRTVVVRAHALSGPSGKPVRVAWLLDGNPAGEVDASEGWKEYRLALPDKHAPEVILGLRASARRASPEDRREIAVAVDSVTVEP